MKILIETKCNGLEAILFFKGKKYTSDLIPLEDSNSISELRVKAEALLHMMISKAEEESNGKEETEATNTT